MSDRPRQKEKTQRAFAAYLDLVDTADWIRKELRGPLETFGITTEEFRLLLMLHREGPMSIVKAAERRMRERANMAATILSLEKSGCVRQEIVTLPLRPTRESRIPIALRGKRREGRRIGMVSLTPAGAKFVESVVPHQAKVAKAHMRVLSYRQQGTLIELCRKLREGDFLKFIKEITLEDVDE
ncbi:MAG: hypothetical protein LAN36_10690 [Acidobacteriia bacterium]|nr:hypothetical protein [Terriglobia bacterium]